jgi:hypothetical protein
MKQIYRPSYVLSHFVHYSSVTVDMAKYYTDYPDSTKETYPKSINHESIHEHVLDELTEGVLIHTKTVLPHETASRRTSCYNASKNVCVVGYACHNTTPFDDSVHTKNIFHDNNGIYCNCWVDEDIERYWIPLLEKAIAEYV